jgi:hypothetical protein
LLRPDQGREQPSAEAGDAGPAASGGPPGTALEPDLSEVPTARLHGVLTPMRLLADLAEEPDIQDMELAGRLRARETAITAELALRKKNR